MLILKRVNARTSVNNTSDVKEGAVEIAPSFIKKRYLKIKTTVRRRKNGKSKRQRDVL